MSKKNCIDRIAPSGGSLTKRWRGIRVRSSSSGIHPFFFFSCAFNINLEDAIRWVGMWAPNYLPRLIKFLYWRISRRESWPLPIIKLPFLRGSSLMECSPHACLLVFYSAQLAIGVSAPLLLLFSFWMICVSSVWKQKEKNGMFAYAHPGADGRVV